MDSDSIYIKKVDGVPVGSTKDDYFNKLYAIEVYQNGEKVSVDGHVHTAEETVINPTELLNKLLPVLDTDYFELKENQLLSFKSSVLEALNIENQLLGQPITWNDIQNKPTTIIGYGITDAFSGDFNDLINVPNYATVTPTPTANDLAVFDGANSIGSDGKLVWDGTTLTVTGNIVASAEITAYGGTPPDSVWEAFPARYSLEVVAGPYVQLVNDVATPTDGYFYGYYTATGRGWYPAGGTSSQWTTSGTAIYYNTGKVGIGTGATINPSAFEVKGGVSSEIFNISNSTDGMELRFGLDATSNYAIIQSAERSVDYRDLVLNPLGGNVGIGITPSYKLHVNGTIYTASNVWGNSFYTVDQGTGTAYLKLTNTGGSSYIGVENSTSTAFGATAYAMTLYASSGRNMEFFTGGSKRLSIDSGTSSLGIGQAANTNYSLITAGSICIDNGTYLYFRNTYSAAISNPNAGTRNLRFDGDSTGSMWLLGNGNLVIGDSTGNQKLTVNGEIGIKAGNNFIHYCSDNSNYWNHVPYSTTAYYLNFGGSTKFTYSSGGAFTAVGEVTAYYSDLRLKNNLGVIDNALDKINSLDGIYYTENDLAKSFGYNNDKRQVGLIAQQVQAIMPESVRLAPFDIGEDGLSKSGENYLTIHYEKIVPLLVQGEKELHQIVKEQALRIETLEKEVELLKN